MPVGSTALGSHLGASLEDRGLTSGFSGQARSCASRGPAYEPPISRPKAAPAQSRYADLRHHGRVAGNSADPLEGLLHRQGELGELLAALRRCPPESIAVFRRIHAATAAEKVATGMVGTEQITAWAQAVHFEEAVELETGFEDLLTQFLVEMSTPELFEPVTAEVCQQWLHTLRKELES